MGSWLVTGNLYGVMIGLLIGYLIWKFPAHRQMIQDRKLRKIRHEIDRIEGGISPNKYIPNSPPPPTPRMRLEAFIQRKREGLYGNKQDGGSRGLVRRARKAALCQPEDRKEGRKAAWAGSSKPTIRVRNASWAMAHWRATTGSHPGR